MNDMTATISRAASAISRHRGVLLPAAAVGMILVLFVPLPPAVMDVLLVVNIALAAVIFLTAMQVGTPLEFSVFPTLLLGTTLLRLVLNVATTRLVLTAGADGCGPEEAQLAAGHVVWAFSFFVTRNSLAVGAILFAIIIVIQFVVVTKGAARVSEVAARFVLDAMPGKQMAIDSDLSAKLITEAQARHRREHIAREADFYGAMDGASKFLRGDAIAAVVITLVDICGGMYVGLAQRGWSWSQTVETFSRLTIGEGLVMQVPAFLVAVSSAIIVTRSSVKTDLGEQLFSQLTSRPAVLVTAGVFLALLTLTPLPTLPLLVTGGACVGLAVILSRKDADAQAAGRTLSSQSESAKTQAPTDLGDLVAVDPLRIEIGFSLVKLVDGRAVGQASDCDGVSDVGVLDRVAAIRKQIAAELGLVVPAVRIRDNMRLDAHTYVIKVRGVKVAQGRLRPDELLAIADASTEGPSQTGKLQGRVTEDPVFGSPAVWISSQQRQLALEMNYTVTPPSAVLGTHLAQVIRTHAAQLLSRQQAAALVESLRLRCPALVQDVLGRFKIATIHKVLQGLLRERVPMHDLEGILEAMSDWPGEADDLSYMCEHVRGSLARTLSQQHCSSDGRLWAVTLSDEMEEEISSRLERTPRGDVLAMDKDLAGRFTRSLDAALEGLAAEGKSPVVLCSPGVRRAVRQLVSGRMEAAVLAYNEIEAVEVKTLTPVRIES